MQLGYVKVNEDKQLTSDQITVRGFGRPEDRDQSLDTAGDNVTRVSIKVGAFGDQDRSIGIFDKIKAAL